VDGNESFEIKLAVTAKKTRRSKSAWSSLSTAGTTGNHGENRDDFKKTDAKNQSSSACRSKSDEERTVTYTGAIIRVISGKDELLLVLGFGPRSSAALPRFYFANHDFAFRDGCRLVSLVKISCWTILLTPCSSHRHTVEYVAMLMVRLLCVMMTN